MIDIYFVVSILNKGPGTRRVCDSDVLVWQTHKLWQSNAVKQFPL